MLKMHLEDCYIYNLVVSLNMFSATMTNKVSLSLSLTDDELLSIIFTDYSNSLIICNELANAIFLCDMYNFRAAPVI